MADILDAAQTNNNGANPPPVEPPPSSPDSLIVPPPPEPPPAPTPLQEPPKQHSDYHVGGKKKLNMKVLVASILLLLLTLPLLLVYVKNQTEIRSKAAVTGSCRCFKPTSFYANGTCKADGGCSCPTGYYVTSSSCVLTAPPPTCIKSCNAGELSGYNKVECDRRKGSFRGYLCGSVSTGCCTPKSTTTTAPPSGGGSLVCVGPTGCQHVGDNCTVTSGGSGYPALPTVKPGKCTLAAGGGGVQICQCATTTTTTTTTPTKCSTTIATYSYVFSNCSTSPTCNEATGVWSCPSTQSKCKTSDAQYTLLSKSCATFPKCNETTGVWFCPTSITPTKPPVIGNTPTTPPGQCGPAGKTCTSVANCGTNCEAQNWACVGVEGARTCQQHGPDLCPGGTCTRVNAYKCSSLDSGGECHQNLRVAIGTFADGRAYAAGCGQVDQVCAGGSRDNLGCGDFEVINKSCGTPVTTPPPTVGPQCVNIKVYKGTTQMTADDLKTLKKDDVVTLAFKGDNASTKGRFRVNSTNETAWQQTTTKNTSEEYILSWTVPENILTFTIEAQTFNGTAWE